MQIAVFCGSSQRVPEPHREMARQVGTEIARRGHTLVYGGCRTGSMGTLADGALAAGGRVVGVILRRFVEQDFHHTGLDELQSVDALHERKSGLTERADAFIVLPGGIGTLEELIDVLSLRKIDQHEKPVVIVDADGFYAGLIGQLERGIESDFDRPRVRDFFTLAKDSVEAISSIESVLRSRAS